VTSVLAPVAVALSLFAVLFGAMELGFRLGRRVKRGDPLPQLGAIQGATLGLLGLLLGFAFAGAASRFIERQDVIVREANAIGTAYLRADLLAEPHRTALRSAVRSYTELRIQLFLAIDDAEIARALNGLDQAEEAMWLAAMAGVDRDRSTMMGVLPPVNEVFDLLAVRNATTDRHLPITVLVLLITCSFVSLLLIGYGCGRDRKRQLLAAGSFAFLVAAALSVTFDLDYPRRGIIRISARPLEAALNGLRPMESPPVKEGRTEP
jgi:hypothetical protein